MDTSVSTRSVLCKTEGECTSSRSFDSTFHSAIVTPRTLGSTNGCINRCYPCETNNTVQSIIEDDCLCFQICDTHSSGNCDLESFGSAVVQDKQMGGEMILGGRRQANRKF